MNKSLLTVAGRYQKITELLQMKLISIDDGKKLLISINNSIFKKGDVVSPLRNLTCLFNKNKQYTVLKSKNNPFRIKLETDKKTYKWIKSKHFQLYTKELHNQKFNKKVDDILKE